MPPSSANAKRKLDEKNYNILKDLLSLDYNKKCFDCGQRGPVYVNMTIGAFVCTSCSGQLRGINPPHRVKSVSMASFALEEMEFIQKRGNEACKLVWLSKFEPGIDAFPESKDEMKIRDHLEKKYERKLWYVPESKSLAEYEAKRIDKPKKPEQKTAAVSLPVGATSAVSRPSPSSASTNKSLVASSSSTSIASVARSGVAPATGSNTGATKTKTLLSQIPKDPFGDHEPIDDNMGFLSHSASLDLFSSQPPLEPNVDKSFSANFQSMSVTPIQPKPSWSAAGTQPSSTMSTATVPAATTAPEPPQDKYAYLASLDDEFKQATTKSTSLTWSEDLKTSATSGHPNPYNSSAHSEPGLFSAPSHSSSLFGEPSTAASVHGYPSQNSGSFHGNPFASQPQPQGVDYSYSSPTGGFPNAAMGTGDSFFSSGGATTGMSGFTGYQQQTTVTPGMYTGNPFASPRANPSFESNSTQFGQFGTPQPQAFGASTQFNSPPQFGGSSSAGFGSPSQFGQFSSAPNQFGIAQSSMFASAQGNQFAAGGEVLNGSMFSTEGIAAMPGSHGSVSNGDNAGFGGFTNTAATGNGVSGSQFSGAANATPFFNGNSINNSNSSGSNLFQTSTSSNFNPQSQFDAFSQASSIKTGPTAAMQPSNWNGSFAGNVTPSATNAPQLWPTSTPVVAQQTVNEGNPFL